MVALLLIAVIGYSGYRIWETNNNYESEAKMHELVLEYKPEDTAAPDGEPEEEIINQSVIDLQAQYPDAVGWLTVPNTQIDYPFVWYKDNDYYLRRDINGNYAQAGTLFMDYRCDRDFSSQNTVIYGHHMKNKSMFGTLQSFNIQTFFDANPTGTIYLPHDTLTLEFFAYMVINPRTEKEVYNVALSSSYVDYVRTNARYYRDIPLAANDRIVTLSTCAYEFNDARMVLIGRVAT